MKPDNRAIHDANWQSWLDMKVHGPASRWLRSLIRSQIDAIPHPERIRSIIDVGCGEGTTTYNLAKWFPNAKTVGIDFSEMGIRCAQARYNLPNLEFIHDVSSNELARKCDLVTAFEVLEHVEDWRQLLQRIADSAQQCILLSFPTGRVRRFEEKIGHYRNFKPGEVEKVLSRYGFEPTIVFYAGFPFFSPMYRALCNATFMTFPPMVTGKYGAGRIFLSKILYFLFRFLSTKRRFGDQFCGLFSRSLQEM